MGKSLNKSSLPSYYSSSCSSPPSSSAMVRVKSLSSHKRRTIRSPVLHVSSEDLPSYPPSQPSSGRSTSGRTANLSDLLNHPPSPPRVSKALVHKRAPDSFVSEILSRAKKWKLTVSSGPFNPSGPTPSFSSPRDPPVGPPVSSLKSFVPSRSTLSSPLVDNVPGFQAFRRSRTSSRGKIPVHAPTPPPSLSSHSSSDFDPRTGKHDSDEETPFTPFSAKSIRRKIPPNVPDFPLVGISFSTEGAEQRWKYVVMRLIAAEKKLCAEMLKCSTIMEVINHVGLIQTISGLSPFYPCLVQEFIVNLPLHFDDSDDSEYQMV